MQIVHAISLTSRHTTEKLFIKGKKTEIVLLHFFSVCLIRLAIQAMYSNLVCWSVDFLPRVFYPFLYSSEHLHRLIAVTFSCTPLPHPPVCTIVWLSYIKTKNKKIVSFHIDDA